jgi:membrane-associated phospholipid phosphatase
LRQFSLSLLSSLHASLDPTVHFVRTYASEAHRQRCRDGLDAQRTHRHQVMRVASAALILFVACGSGCVSTGGRDFGADATASPGFTRIRQAALEAARDPHVWLPLAGAAVFQINGWDRKVSNWARANTPVFGSQQAAADWSDHLRTASSVAYFSTVLLTPGPAEVGPWIADKAQGLTVGLGAIATTGLATSTLKRATGRQRPNGEGHESFPSGHTSHSAVLTGLARDDLEYADLSPFTRTALDAGLDALTVGTAWARVEAGAHFPSDTLVSIALGSFVSGMFDRAFLEAGTGPRVSLNLEPLPHGLELHCQLRY